LILSEYFSEELRIKSNKYQVESPEQYWKENSEFIIERCLNTFGELTAYTIRETLYKELPECNSFRVTLAKTLIDMFNGKDVLDMSAGWGDRLIGFLASNAESYTGVDPNLLLKPIHDDIIKTLKHNKTNIKFLYEPFENVELFDDYFDLCVTCPPYFITEIYHTDDEKNQSIYNRNVDEWIDEFMIPSLYKIFAHLRKDGHLVLIMNDPLPKFNVPPYMEIIINHLKKMRGVQYMGAIGFGEYKNGTPRSAQPIWIFKNVMKK